MKGHISYIPDVLPCLEEFFCGFADQLPSSGQSWLKSVPHVYFSSCKEPCETSQSTWVKGRDSLDRWPWSFRVPVQLHLVSIDRKSLFLVLLSFLECCCCCCCCRRLLENG